MRGTHQKNDTSRTALFMRIGQKAYRPEEVGSPTLSAWCHLYHHVYVAVLVTVLLSLWCVEHERTKFVFCCIAKMFLLWKDNLIAMRNELTLACQVCNLPLTWLTYKNHPYSHMVDVGTEIQMITSNCFPRSYSSEQSNEDLNPGLTPNESLFCNTNNGKYFPFHLPQC